MVRPSFRLRFFLLLFFTVPLVASAQVPVDYIKEGAVGWGIWYGQGRGTVDAAPDSASQEIKAYTNVLPAEIEGGGIVLGLSFGTWGISIGQDDTGEISINKTADPQGNGISSDDVTVLKVRRINRSFALIWQPARFFYFGVGEDTGHIEFQQTTSSGEKETKKIAYSNRFYSYGLAFGFDPKTNDLAPVFTFYVKHPISPGDFSGATTGLGAGLYF
ncbi:MAG: hypothetical protein COB67_09860 [SAR324 cluster bacterium]|uniref:Outer membrane protein beta-barrel domain-containing protein n=1 Tax=SAR324 cluster bacterium TaxID=2024889 RepID=A0A2A4SZW1_9DELT|nr:MAG: hypothetical protein COB67_09860 [SAR324 cluster bacterium]